MSFKFLADHFSITRDSDHFIQLKTLKNPKTEDEAWVLFSVEGESKFARATVQDLIDTFETIFFDQFEVQAYERFENALREVNLIYKSLLEKKGPGALGELSAVIAIFSENELHLAQCNQAEAYLIRKEKLSHISEGLSSRGEDLFVNIASGEILPEDKIIFSTVRLLRSISQTQLVQSCRDGVTEAIDAIRENMMEDGEISLGVSCVHVQVPYRNRAPGAAPVEGFREKWREFLEKFAEMIPGNLGEKTRSISRNTFLAAILAIVLILIISISFLMESSRDKAIRGQIRKEIAAMNEQITAATAKGYATEKENANLILDKVETDAQKILEQDIFRTEILALLEQAQLTRDDINNTLRVADATPYIDLSAKKKDIKALGLAGLDEKLFAFDPTQLYPIVVDQVMDPKPLGQNEALVQVTAMEDLDQLVFLTQSGQIVEYDGNKFDSTNTQDEKWKGGVDLAAYGRFIYLLNPTDNQIYKYSRGNSGYSTASNYNMDANLEGALSIAIDGSVYVLKQGGEIVKIFKGQAEDFKVENLAVSLEDAKEIYTLPEMNYLYVMDPVNQRIIILEKKEKNASYHAQVQFDELNLKGIYVDKAEENLYALSENGLYKISLKELALK